jgi:succinyl-CoA synthetase beta subunit
MTFLLKHLYDFFISKDVELMELNPIVLGTDE